MKTIADISGNNAAHFLTADLSIIATAVFLGAVGGPARVGDANVSASRGASIETGRIFTLHAKTAPQGGYVLGRIKCYIPNGTTLTISYDDE